MKKLLFLDRDGTLIAEPADFQIDSVEKFRLLPGVISALLRFKAEGYCFVMVSNQDGLGTARYPQEKFDLIQKLLLDVFESQGIYFTDILICPHLPEERCQCRKPGVKLVKDFLTAPDLDRKNSFVVGDRTTDLELASNMNLEGFLLSESLSWPELAEQLLTRPRVGSCTRKTKETSIRAHVNLDGQGQAKIATGIGFFDHMLEQLAKHAGFDLTLVAEGDTHIDDHHTVEDAAITLGTALREALSNKIGIERFGFHLPMDDAAAHVLLDLCGRTYFKFEGKFERELVGTLATEMVPHFFRSLAEGLKANLHIQIEGENTHHKVEAAFKGVGRSLRIAIAVNGSKSVPSTKGSL